MWQVTCAEIETSTVRIAETVGHCMPPVLSLLLMLMHLSHVKESGLGAAGCCAPQLCQKIRVQMPPPTLSLLPTLRMC